MLIFCDPDVIVFSNGEKLNPVTIEEIVSDHPDLIGALVVAIIFILYFKVFHS